MSRHSLLGAASPLTPDASTREYYRIRWNSSTAIACIYPEPFNESSQPYIASTKLFAEAGLPVAAILDFDEELGVVVQEDFGDTILRNVLDTSTDEQRENYISEAIGLIARIQSATAIAKNTKAIASTLTFDFEKLMWELDFFMEHYFGTLRKEPLENGERKRFLEELEEVCRRLEERASVLTHRDFHAANLMVARDGSLKIIDHQDARIGTASYDLVSLLLDRVTVPPTPEWLAEKRLLLIEKRAALGLPMPEEEVFATEFRLQTVQRCLKAIGTFSYQSAVRGRTNYLIYITPMFEIVLRSAGNIGSLPTIEKVVGDQLLKEFP